MGTCVHFSRSLPSNSWWQTMAGGQVLSRPSAAEGGGRRPAFTGPATQPYSATEVDGWQHKLSRVSQNRAAVHERERTEDEMNASGSVNLQKLEEQLAREPVDEIAALMRALTYGEMIELAEGLWNVNGQGSEISKDNLPGLLHRWSTSRTA
jgi:hypothetical protein